MKKTIFGMMSLCLALFMSNRGYTQASTLSRAVIEKDNFQGAVPLPQQKDLAAKKIAEFKKKHGQKPNIVLIVADDMGYSDLGSYGGGVAFGAATPNIDKLAKGGLRLTSCYSQPTCTPTRSAILTGRLPVRTGLNKPILAGAKITKNPWEGEISIAELLSKQGYYTLLSGKWHIGEGDGMKPHEVGFDEFYGYYKAQKEYTQVVDERRFPDLVLDEEKMAAFKKLEPEHDGLVHGFKGKSEVKMIRPVDAIEDMAEGDRMLKEFTVSKIKELAQSDKPFFIEHAFMKIHADNFPSEAFKGKSQSKFQIKDAIVEIDHYVGEIVQALEENGLMEKTLIFFTSDNGPQLDAFPDSGTTPFKGAKGTGWEGGIRIPGIAYWKDMIEPEQESDELFDLMDLFNTFATLGGINLQQAILSTTYIDGVDQTAFLLADNVNEGARSARDKIFVWSGSTFLACRMYEYKMHVKVVEYKETNLAIDMANTLDVGLAPWVFNLYVDPKESYPLGHRQNAWMASISTEAKAHAATFKKFPPKNIGL